MTTHGFPPRLAPAVLEGEDVRLEPLRRDHLDGLWAVASDPSLWRITSSRVRTRDDLVEYVELALGDAAAGVALPFATVHRASGRIVGSTRFANYAAPHGRVEIGWTWIGHDWQGTAVNVEAKRLMLAHAFDTLGLERVELKTSAVNARSRAAILALGATEEGTLRHHMRNPDDSWRDSVYYSILRAEWPAVRLRLDARLLARRAAGAPARFTTP